MADPVETLTLPEQPDADPADPGYVLLGTPDPSPATTATLTRWTWRRIRAAVLRAAGTYWPARPTPGAVKYAGWTAAGVPALYDPPPAYTLPVAGAALGGVRAGGNVTIGPDGTLTAPAGGPGGYVLPVARPAVTGTAPAPAVLGGVTPTAAGNAAVGAGTALAVRVNSATGEMAVPVPLAFTLSLSAAQQTTVSASGVAVAADAGSVSVATADGNSIAQLDPAGGVSGTAAPDPARPAFNVSYGLGPTGLRLPRYPANPGDAPDGTVYGYTAPADGTLYLGVDPAAFGYPTASADFHGKIVLMTGNGPVVVADPNQALVTITDVAAAREAVRGTVPVGPAAGLPAEARPVLFLDTANGNALSLASADRKTVTVVGGGGAGFDAAAAHTFTAVQTFAGGVTVTAPAGAAAVVTMPSGYAIGAGAKAHATAGLALGDGAWATGSQAVAVGLNSRAGGLNGLAVGPLASAAGDNATAVGALASAGGAGSVALGNGAACPFASSAAVGAGVVLAANETAFGCVNGYGAVAGSRLTGYTDAAPRSLCFTKTEWVDSADTTRKARVKLTVNDAANPVVGREAVRYESDGTQVKIAFFGGTASAKPALTYSRTGEPASAGQLRAALAALGLVTDSTVA